MIQQTESQQRIIYNILMDISSFTEGLENGIRIEGMPTLRDRFAMAALTGYCANDKKLSMPMPELCQTAYRCADAMIEARKQDKGGDA